jgi:hypothetical protein
MELNNVFITTLLLVCSTHANAAMPADGDSTPAANQSMRVVTFKAVPETERLFILANSVMELIKKTALLNISYQ